MIPPFPSPPITVLVSFILMTTFTSPTALAVYVPPCFWVTSRNALEDDKLETVFPPPNFPRT